MKLKNILCMILALSLMLCLCACGGDQNPTDPTGENVGGDTGTSSSDGTTVGNDPAPSYTVKVVDEGGNPIVGAWVQLCLGTCSPAVTDDKGVASYYDMAEGDYDVKLVTMPAGYTYTTEEQVFHFAPGSHELTITLKAVS